MSLVKQLRDAAMECSNADYRVLLRYRADKLSQAIHHFWKDADEEQLRVLNGAWAAAVYVLKNIPPEAPPAPLAGSPEPARLAA